MTKVDMGVGGKRDLKDWNVPKNLKDWNVPKDLALDRTAWKSAVHVPEP